ncbi:cholesterol 24-hydroxylase-like [Corticium candelabrum]|uniref:cholesterol 24-hydroxylase-like n=1 Tax=Corticium candelabrum TaxID=121492 RepID=UPI002E2762AF|nr:cholesterol 24-hydroxylase-like [Corticium candelabrum]
MVVFTILAVITAVLVATVGVLALLLANTRRRYWHIPHPPLDNFWLGHAGMIDRRMNEMNEGSTIDEILLEYSKKYGEVIVFFLVHVPQVSITLNDSNAMRQLGRDATLAKPIFVTGLKCLYGNRFFGNFLEGVNDLNVWLKRQKLFAPFYSKKNLRDVIGVTNEVIDKYIAYLDKESEKGETVCMKETNRFLTSAIGGRVSLGVDIDRIDQMMVLDRAVIQGFNLYADMMNDPLTRYLPIYRGKWQKAKETCALLRGGITEIIEKRQKESSETNGYGWKDFLGLALEAMENGEYDFEEMVDVMVEAFDSSHVGMVATVNNCLKEILQHPEVEKQLVEEVDRVLEGKPFVSFTDLQSFHYLACVLKESLRCHPTLPYLLRETTTDLTVAGYPVPAASFVHISIYCMHHNDKFWPDPNKFDPNRFYSLTGDHDPSANLSFGSGMRACLGRAYAEQELKMIFARLFQAFTFEMEKQSKEYDKYGTKLMPLMYRDPINCKIKRRLVNETASH